jgi:hypothetical protein
MSEGKFEIEREYIAEGFYVINRIDVYIFQYKRTSSKRSMKTFQPKDT